MATKFGTAVKGATLVALIMVGVFLVRGGLGNGEDARRLPAATEQGQGTAVQAAHSQTGADTVAAQPGVEPAVATDDDAADDAGGPQSIEDLEQMVAENREDPDAWRQLGIAMVQSHEYVRAAEAFAAAVELRPDDARLRSDLATALLYQGLVRVARSEYERALELDPELAEAHFNLGITYSHAAPMDVPAAMAQWTLALQYAGEDQELAKLAQDYLDTYGATHHADDDAEATVADGDGDADGDAAEGAETSSEAPAGTDDTGAALNQSADEAGEGEPTAARQPSD